MNISTQNYFEIFSIAESFQIDIDALTQEYRKLQARFHPDKYINEDDQFRLFALQTTSILNEAYRCLKSPLQRAGYLLTLHGVDPEENNQQHLGNEFLFKQIELREKLEKISDANAIDELEQLKVSIVKEQQTLLAEFEMNYEKGAYQNAKPVYSKLQFLYKLLSEIDAVEEKLLDF